MCASYRTSLLLHRSLYACCICCRFSSYGGTTYYLIPAWTTCGDKCWMTYSWLPCITYTYQLISFRDATSFGGRRYYFILTFNKDSFCAPFLYTQSDDLMYNDWWEQAILSEMGAVFSEDNVVETFGNDEEALEAAESGVAVIPLPDFICFNKFMHVPPR